MATLHLRQIQLEKLNRLLNEVWERNAFYTHKWCGAGVPHHHLDSLDQLAEFPLLTRDELLADQHARPPFGTNLTYPMASYKRVHRSSGTTGTPIFWPDTFASWRWLMQCSQQLFVISGIKSDDRILFISNFGASSGSAIMYEAACQFGCACFAVSSDDVATQIKFLRECSPTVLVAGASELNNLAKLASENGLLPRNAGVSKIISFGKTCSFEVIRQHATAVWNAKSFDRYGMTEAGSIASECHAHLGMHLLENEFIAEVLDPGTCKPVENGATGELVLTNLGRADRPIIRYRTGDIVRMVRDHHCVCGRKNALLVGGVSRSR
jgi:phenylacetate-CoA ligase